MHIIKNNPFRILGITTEVSERIIQKQINIIKRYSEIGKIKFFDYDFEFIGSIDRSIENIQNAAGKIEQESSKLLHALFWFVRDNTIDEIALNYLKNNNLQKAIEIWEKTLKNNINERNYSSYQNLSTLYIALSLNENYAINDYLYKGITLKGKLLNSDEINKFASLVTAGNNININLLEKEFINEVISFLKKQNNISEKNIINLFDGWRISTKRYIVEKITQPIISSIENNINKYIRLRKNDKKAANKYGEFLYKSTIYDIKKLKNILGGNNYHYNVLVNKLANEILQCSIVFFNARIDDYDYNPAADALKIAEFARSLGATGQIKSRIDENIKIIRSWLDIKKSSPHISPHIKKDVEKPKNELVAIFIILVIAITIVLIVFGNNSKRTYKNNTNKYKSTENEFNAIQKTNTYYKDSEYQNNSAKNRSYNNYTESKYKGNSLKNGTSPYQKYYGRGVYSKYQENSILFKNGYKKDAIVFLIEYYNHKVIRHEYIKAGTSFKMTNIPTGYYYIKVYSGKDWNPNKIINNGKLIGGFDTSPYFYKSSGRPIYLLDDGKKYSVHTITLYTVQDGNFQTTPISENIFFN